MRRLQRGIRFSRRCCNRRCMRGMGRCWIGEVGSSSRIASAHPSSCPGVSNSMSAGSGQLWRVVSRRFPSPAGLGVCYPCTISSAAVTSLPLYSKKIVSPAPERGSRVVKSGTSRYLARGATVLGGLSPQAPFELSRLYVPTHSSSYVDLRGPT